MLILLHKRGDSRLHSNYQTITLIPHSNKVILRILDNQIKVYLYRQITPAEQAEFIVERGSRNR